MDLGLRTALENFTTAWDLVRASDLTALSGCYWGEDQTCFLFSTSEFEKGIILVWLDSKNPDELQMCAHHYGLTGSIRAINNGTGYCFEARYKDGQPWIDPNLLDAAISAKVTA